MAITCLIVFRRSLDPALTSDDYSSAESSIHDKDHTFQVNILQHFLRDIACQGFFGTEVFEDDSDSRYSKFSDLLYSFAQSFYLLQAYSDLKQVSCLQTHILIHHLISDLNCVDPDFGVKFDAWTHTLQSSDISKSRYILPSVIPFSLSTISVDELGFFPLT